MTSLDDLYMPPVGATVGPGGLSVIDPEPECFVTLAVTAEGKSLSQREFEQAVRDATAAVLINTNYWIQKVRGKHRDCAVQVRLSIEGKVREMTCEQFEAEYAPWHQAALPG